MTMEISDLVIPKDKIILHKEYTLGRGGYGYVCYGTREIHNGEWEPVAVKMMITEGCIPESAKKELIKEACKLREVCQRDNIVKLLGILMEPDNYGLILELMVFENSIHFINEYSVVWPQNVLPVQICQQVSSAMAYLNSFDPPMLHMDLKGENILINHDFDAKVCDFGISEWKTRTTRPANSRQGTLSHVAPEILLDVNIRSTKAQDVYSFGICTWELFTGQQPYRGKNDELIKTSVKEGQRPDMKDIEKRCPDDIVTMMKQCWSQYPEMRPSFEELQTHLGAMCKTIKKEIFLGKKAVRKIICQKHPGVNDIKNLMTSHWDGLDEPLNVANININAEPISQETVVDISTNQQEEASKDEEEKNVEVAPVKESPPLSGKRYKFNLPKKNLTEFDKKVREVLRDPLLTEMVVSGNADHLNFPGGVKELFLDPILLQKNIEEDTAFKLELQGQGHSVFDSIQSSKIKDAKHKGMACPYREEGLKTERKHKRTDRLNSMMTCFYKGKLKKNGLDDKVVKALKDPHQVKEAVMDLQTGSEEVEKFSVFSHDVLEVLQDPVMMQILLSEDQEMLDTYMRDYPDVMVKLLAKNKTTYPKGGIDMRELRDRDIDRDHFDEDPFYRDPFDWDRFGRDRIDRFGHDPFDSDSDDERREMLARAAFDMGIPPRALASGGVDKRRMMEMSMREERRRRKERDARQAALNKDKKQEPGNKMKPTPPTPSEAGDSSKASSSQGVKDSASKKPSPGTGSKSSSNNLTSARDLEARKSVKDKDATRPGDRPSKDEPKADAHKHVSNDPSESEGNAQAEASSQGSQNFWKSWNPWKMMRRKSKHEKVKESENN